MRRILGGNLHTVTLASFGFVQRGDCINGGKSKRDGRALDGGLGLESVSYGNLRGCRARGGSGVVRLSMQGGVVMTLSA